MKSIQIYKQDGVWYTAFMGDDKQPDREVIEVMGTHHLPTAYRESVSQEYVLSEVTRMNPDSVVTVS